jgi:hypothetical protein
VGGLLPSEGAGKEPLDRSSLPYVAGWREGGTQPLPDRSGTLSDSSNPLPVSNDGERGKLAGPVR